MADSNNHNKCKIKHVIEGSQLINPLLVTLNNRSLTNDELDNCECSWYNLDEEKSNRLVKFSNGNNANYQGTVKINGNMCKTMLVLQNKKTNKIKLIEVNECRLERELPKVILQTNYDNDEIQTTYEENRTKLLKEFGSKKSKRVSDIGTKMRINSEMISTQIKHSVAGVEVNLKEIQLADSMIDTCLPPCHREATNPSEVFLLEDLLSEAELNSMEDEAFTIFHLMPFTAEKSGYSQFFIDTLDRLQYKVCEERIKILLYVDALMKFLQLSESKLKLKKIIEQISPFSSLIAKKVLENFSVDGTNGRTRNTTMDDKTVIYIIVLIIIACESCNIEELSKYLPKFSVIKLGQIVRALSLSTRDKITWFVKLPLPLPRSRFMRKRKN